MSVVGWVGLGKLGAPCAAALQRYGNHTVYGYDVRGVNGTYDWSELEPVKLVETIDDVVAQTDNVVYLAVQTPHAPRYGGEVLVPNEPRDFEYSFLRDAVAAIVDAATRQQKIIMLVIVSTVLPGTFDRHLRPLLSDYVIPVYHPFFIAMGTVVDDFVTPELVLIGADDAAYAAELRALYAPIHDAPFHVVSIASAELTKVAYNTFISMKIVYANTMMEMAEHTGADVDDVTSALALATQRIISPRYLAAGMGDGGACHPRDNVALSALAQRYDLSVDLMGFLTHARERQTNWLVDNLLNMSELLDRPIIVLGKTYKPNVVMTDGSPALLLVSELRARGCVPMHVDPLIDADDDVKIALSQPAVFMIATRHDAFATYDYPIGSFVVDPFGYVNRRPGVTVWTPGRR